MGHGAWSEVKAWVESPSEGLGGVVRGGALPSMARVLGKMETKLAI